jgi:SAM-dependent methyltransferase
MADRWTAFDLVEAFHLSHAVATLHDQGLLASLREPATGDDLAAAHGLDAGLLRGVLEYVAARTDLLRKSGERFVASRGYSPEARFLLDHYAGAYGRNAVLLAAVLRNPSKAPRLVNRLRHARAFEAVAASALGGLPQIIRQLELNYVFDLGCGPGALLVELATTDPYFVGWGIDLSRAMCAAARRRSRAAGVGARVRVLEGDCTRLSAVLPAKVRAAVQTVTACNLANELFGHGHARAAAWLRALRKVLPGRLLLIADYYGRLGQRRGPLPRHTALHDYVQLISGQGVPPADAAAWRRIYSRAGCRLAHILEDRTTTRFVHILQL